MQPRNWGLLNLLLLAGIVALVIVGIHSLVFPHEIREPDEASYAYMGESFLLGKEFYFDVWDNKPPGVYLIYAAGFSLTPHDMTGVRLFQYLSIFGIIFCLLVLGSDKMGIHPFLIGLWSLFFFTFTPIEPHVALTELFALFFITSGITLAFILEKKEKIIAGTVLSASLFFSLLGLIPILAYIFSSKNKSILIGFITGSVALATMILWSWPSFLDFFIRFHLEYAQSWSQDVTRIDRIVKLGIFLILPIVAAFFWGIQSRKEPSGLSRALMCVLIGGMVAIIAVQSFFPHHFLILAVPLIGLFSIGTHTLMENNKRINMLLVGGFFIVYIGALLFFHWPHAHYAPPRITETIHQIIPEGEDMWVVGYMPELYWYSHRRNHLPFFSTIMILDHRMKPFSIKQKEVIMGWFDRVPPKYIIVLSPVFLEHRDISQLLCEYSSTEYAWMFKRRENIDYSDECSSSVVNSGE